MRHADDGHRAKAVVDGVDLTVVLEHADGTERRVPVKHSMTAMRIEYFKAGSSVNRMGSRG